MNIRYRDTVEIFTAHIDTTRSRKKDTFCNAERITFDKVLIACGNHDAASSPRTGQQRIETKPQEQTVWTTPKKNCRKQRLDSARQCNSSAVFDLVVAEIHMRQRRIGLVVVAARCRVRNTQSGSF